MHENTDNGPLRLRTPNDVVTLVPYLVGEELPRRAMVLLIMSGRKVSGVLVGDLDHDNASNPAVAARRAVELGASAGDRILVIAYGPSQDVTPHVQELLAVASEQGVEVVHALRVHEFRFWSYTCERDECCPPEGTLIDSDRSAAPAEAVLHGLVGPSPVFDPITQAQFALEPFAFMEPEQASAAIAAAVDETEQVEDINAYGAQQVSAAIEAERTGKGLESVADLARLALLVGYIPVRDEVWYAIDKDNAEVHAALWTRVVRTVPTAHRVAPAMLLAVAAWVQGDTPMAQAGVRTALGIDPTYSMARLMKRALAWGLSPEQWFASLSKT